MVKVYFISGLGADCRLFAGIELPPGYEKHYLEYSRPQQGDTLALYARRMAERIDQSGEFVLIGLSMGGMVACECNSFLSPRQTIIISSIPGRPSFPWYFKFIGKTRLHRLVPYALLRNINLLVYYFRPRSPEAKALLNDYVRHADTVFNRWAIHAILNWKSNHPVPRLTHIHGTRDRILPHRFVHPTHTIQNGSHLMVLDRADEVNEILREVLGGG